MIDADDAHVTDSVDAPPIGVRRSSSAARQIARGVPRAPSPATPSLLQMSSRPHKPRADQILLGENLELLPVRGRDLPADLHRPSVQHRPDAGAQDAAGVAGRGRRARPGFRGARYARELLARLAYSDCFEDYLGSSSRGCTKPTGCSPEGTLYFHIDYREAHHCKLLLDEIFGRECFLNEIMWAYDYGARANAAGPPSTTRSSCM